MDRSKGTSESDPGIPLTTSAGTWGLRPRCRYLSRTGCPRRPCRRGECPDSRRWPTARDIGCGGSTPADCRPECLTIKGNYIKICYPIKSIIIAIARNLGHNACDARKGTDIETNMWFALNSYNYLCGGKPTFDFSVFSVDFNNAFIAQSCEPLVLTMLSQAILLHSICILLHCHFHWSSQDLIGPDMATGVIGGMATASNGFPTVSGTESYTTNGSVDSN